MNLLPLEILYRGKYVLYETINIETFLLRKNTFENIQYPLIGKAYLGIDPGSRHAGITIIPFTEYSEILVNEITFPKEEDYLDRLALFSNTLHRISHYWMLDSLCIIEGASFSDKYGQTQLEEMRTADRKSVV